LDDIGIVSVDRVPQGSVHGLPIAEDGIQLDSHHRPTDTAGLSIVGEDSKVRGCVSAIQGFGRFDQQIRRFSQATAYFQRITQMVCSLIYAADIQERVTVIAPEIQENPLGSGKRVGVMLRHHVHPNLVGIVRSI
jgi:hypothetical protein